MNAVISGTGAYVPPDVVTNQALAHRFGIETTHEWIVQRTGIEERRFAAPGVGTAELSVPAARQAIEDAGLEPRDIDLVVFATLSPDHCFPGSGVMLVEKLGLCDAVKGRFTGALDVRDQCSGFIYGLGTAASMVQSGACRHVLVVGSEVHSHALDLSTRGRTVATLFGDGAGAVVVSASDEPGRGVLGWHVGSDGRYAQVLAQRVWNIAEWPFIPVDEAGVGRVQPEHMWAQMDGKLVFRHAVERMTEALLTVCQKTGVAGEEVDLYAFHQANLRINQYVAHQLGIPEAKLLTNINKYGNTTAATIPLLLAEAARGGRLQRGMTVACVAFGSGFTWGSALVRW